jgi:hypothetical protein
MLIVEPVALLLPYFDVQHSVTSMNSWLSTAREVTKLGELKGESRSLFRYVKYGLTIAQCKGETDVSRN